MNFDKAAENVKQRILDYWDDNKKKGQRKVPRLQRRCKWSRESYGYTGTRLDLSVRQITEASRAVDRGFGGSLGWEGRTERS